MGADYREQYRPDQLEPFWPNEIIKMSVVVLCTLAVIMLLAVLPVLLDMAGLHGLEHAEEPANPRGSTPVGIKPEWYFLATYQYLRLMPTELFGISGKMLGVLSQGPLVAALVTLPFWYRKKANQRPGWLYRAAVTAVLFSFLGLTIWGGWPEHLNASGEEELIPLKEYLHQRPMMFVMMALAVVVLYLLLSHERKKIRKLLDSPPESAQAQPELRSAGVTEGRP